MEKFSQKNVSFWHNLNKKLLFKNRKIKINNLQKKIFIKNLIKIGYSIKKTKQLKLNSEQYLKLITKAFQRRFRQELINGKIDKECLLISQNLVKKFK